MTKFDGPLLQTLLALIDEAYDRKAWHGQNLRGSLKGVSATEAAWRPAEGRHNIWEITIHAAYWKYAVKRRLLGEKRGSFPLKGSNWLYRPLTIDPGQWRDDLLLLEDMHRGMRSAIARLTPADLRHTPRGGKTDTRTLIIGIANHDIYHAGQIQLLKKLHGSVIGKRLRRSVE